MLRGGLLALILLAATLAGCVGGGDTGARGNDGITALASDRAPAFGASDPLPPGTRLKPTDTQLWKDPRTAPHPAHNFPTLTTVPPNAPDFWQPIPQRTWSLEGAALEHIADDRGTAIHGSGIGIFGQLLVVPQRGAGEIKAYAISDPAEPELISSMASSGRDTDFIAFPHGRLFAVFASDTQIVPVWDLTDPVNPLHVVDIQPRAGSHNVAVVPGTPILYNANEGSEDDYAGLHVGWTEIYDLSNPAEPTQVAEFENGYGCHDISFHIDQENEKYRAYCAGVEATQIWDITDPRRPEVISTIPYPFGQEGLGDGPPPTYARLEGSFSHMVVANDDGTVLMVGDETGLGIAPACDGYVDAGGNTASGPLGNVWFYDISDEANPELVSWISPSNEHLADPERHQDNLDRVEQRPELGTAEWGALSHGCTAHMGRIIPHEDRDLLAIAYYGMGVMVVDFTELENPRFIAQWGTRGLTFDVWYYQGYLFTGDERRGMDVLTFGS